MSTLELEHIKHTSSSSNNLSTHSDGSLTVGNVNALSVTGHAAVGANIVDSSRALSIAGATDGSSGSIINCFNSSLASKFSVRDDGFIQATKGAVGTLATFTDGVATNFTFKTDASNVGTFGTEAGSTHLAFMASGTERMRIDYNGYVGINRTNPDTRLVVWGNVTTSNFTGYRYTSTGTSSSTGGSSYCMYTYGNVMVYGQIRVGSDRRIKENIMDVPDNDALVLLRNIPCRYYEHIDKVNMRPGKTIGFIAQEVKSVFPIAVSLKKDTIPNVYKIISCEWTGNVMYSQELGTVSGVKYRFYVSNDLSGNGEEMKEVIGNEDNTFTFDQSWNNVFCYGKEVDDFHILDKQKIFALNFSATQEIDRRQQEEKTKLEAAEAKIASLEAENVTLKARLDAIEARLNAGGL